MTAGDRCRCGGRLPCRGDAHQANLDANRQVAEVNQGLTEAELRELWDRETMWNPPEPPSSYGIPQAPPPFRPQYLGERYDPPGSGWRFVAGPGYLFTGPLGYGSPRSKWKARWWRVWRVLRRLWRRSAE